jgi:Arc/MetJ family transcription regulator
MRTTIEIDERKISAAQAIHQNLNKTELVDLALSELIRIQKNRDLSKLAGKFPKLNDVPRRKF